MNRKSTSLFVLSLIVLFVQLTPDDVCEAQVFETTYTTFNAPIPLQPVAWSYDSGVRTVGVQTTYAAFYAPQVPVVPLASGPVTTVSAYYVPTVPVTQQFIVPVVPTHQRFHRHFRKHHRHRVSTVNVAVVPSVALRPVYWLPW